MDEEKKEEVVTTVTKVKNPKLVENGKRTQEKLRAKREAAKQKQELLEVNENIENIETTSSSSWILPIAGVVLVGCVLVGGYISSNNMVKKPKHVPEKTEDIIEKTDENSEKDIFSI